MENRKYSKMLHWLESIFTYTFDPMLFQFCATIAALINFMQNKARLQVSVTEIFKTKNDINPSYMQNIFITQPNTKFCPNDIEVRYHKTTNYSHEG